MCFLVGHEYLDLDQFQVRLQTNAQFNPKLQMITFFPSSWVFLQSHFSKAFFGTHFSFPFLWVVFLQSHFSRPFYRSRIFPFFWCFCISFLKGFLLIPIFFPSFSCFLWVSFLNCSCNPKLFILFGWICVLILQGAFFLYHFPSF